MAEDAVKKYGHMDELDRTDRLVTNYKVAVTEIKRRVVMVAASSEKEAHDRVLDAWRNGEIILSDDDFEGVEAHVLGEWDREAQTDSKDGHQRIDSKDIH